MSSQAENWLSNFLPPYNPREGLSETIDDLLKFILSGKDNVIVVLKLNSVNILSEYLLNTHSRVMRTKVASVLIRLSCEMNEKALDQDILTKATVSVLANNCVLSNFQVYLESINKLKEGFETKKFLLSISDCINLFQNTIMYLKLKENTSSMFSPKAFVWDFPIHILSFEEKIEIVSGIYDLVKTGSMKKPVQSLLTPFSEEGAGGGGGGGGDDSSSSSSISNSSTVSSSSSSGNGVGGGGVGGSGGGDRDRRITSPQAYFEMVISQFGAVIKDLLVKNKPRTPERVLLKKILKEIREKTFFLSEDE